jgi:hypothetical protein
MSEAWKLSRFTLVSGQWYALTMFPGYSNRPYHSPIRVDSIAPLGDRSFEMEFLNLAYAAGVQLFRKRLRTLRRSVTHLVAEEMDVEDRTYAITQLNAQWFTRHFEGIPASQCFDTSGEPIEEALLKLANTSY